jgi:hypothetical protein
MNIIFSYTYLFFFFRNDPTDTDTIICIDDSDTLSNQSAGNIEQEQRDFDQRWAMSIRMENGEMSTPLVNCETFNSLEDVKCFKSNVTWFCNFLVF